MTCWGGQLMFFPGTGGPDHPVLPVISAHDLRLISFFTGVKVFGHIMFHNFLTYFFSNPVCAHFTLCMHVKSETDKSLSAAVLRRPCHVVTKPECREDRWCVYYILLSLFRPQSVEKPHTAKLTPTCVCLHVQPSFSCAKGEDQTSLSPILEQDVFFCNIKSKKYVTYITGLQSLICNHRM